MKYLIVLFLLAGCSTFKPKVKDEVKKLQLLQSECQQLQDSLDDLGAKKWTKTIDEKVKACKAHGFWEFKKRKIKTYMDGIE